LLAETNGEAPLKLLLITLAALTLGALLSAAPPTAETEVPELLPLRSRWRDFNLYLVYAGEAGGGNTQSLGMDWQPTFWSDGPWRMCGQFGGQLIYASRRTYPVPALSLQLLAARQLRNWFAAAGGGTETWIGFGGTAPALSFQFGYELRAAHVTRIYLAYSPVFFKLFTSKIILGMGLNF